MSSAASKTLLSTPRASPSKAGPVPDSPGTWRHPRLEEIARRQERATFTSANVRKITFNLGVLAILWLGKAFLRLIISPSLFPQSVNDVLGWIWLACFSIPILGIGWASKPIWWWKKDDLSDIPLSAAQRKLLNLPPTPVAASPTAVSTPPRYSRTPSISGSVGSRASYASSPLSGRGSPIIGGNLGGSPYSPAGSPLAQKKPFSPVVSGSRRSSLGSPAALGASTAASLFSEPATPSPSAGKRVSVGLNSKWLYERGRRSSGGAWQY